MYWEKAMLSKFKVIDINIMVYIIGVSFWLAYSHVTKTFHIWTAEQFANFQVPLPFNARFLLYSIIKYCSQILNIQLDVSFGKKMYLLLDFLSLMMTQIILYRMFILIYGSKIVSVINLVIFSYISPLTI